MLTHREEKYDVIALSFELCEFGKKCNFSEHASQSIDRALQVVPVWLVRIIGIGFTGSDGHPFQSADRL